ncbi:metallophosphoesterase [Agromyces sp. NPDC058484]|uniref:metallophosphoesterase n=1 Tax=Agromyces sp. NPDC058484 TaxID=3346524 RepID=UPI00365572CC
MSEYPRFDFDQVDFITADTHFGHQRIIELADRPFGSVDEMNDEMTRRWNDIVGPDDVVLHLGDVALGPIEESMAMTRKLNGRRFLIPGNHDRVSSATQTKAAIERFRPLYEAAGWEILPEIVEGTRSGHRLLACHYPYWGDSQEVERHRAHRPRNDEELPLLHGHTHARDHGPGGLEFHVGVDAHGFAPIPFARIDEWITTIHPGLTRLNTAIRDAREIVTSYENVPWPEMDALYYTQGYNDLRAVLGELLDALDAPEPDSHHDEALPDGD